jgi:hypothetical protein
MRAERVRRTRQNHQQITGARSDHIVLDQQVKGAVQNVEQLRRIVVSVRHRAIGATAERDAVTAQRPRWRYYRPAAHAR